jgi:hypothetical protein
MSYDTFYQLEVIGAGCQEIRSIIREYATYDPFIERCSWYQYEAHCQSASNNFPDSLIIIKGYGEELGNVWMKVWFAGKVVFSWNFEFPEIPVDIKNLARPSEKYLIVLDVPLPGISDNSIFRPAVSRFFWHRDTGWKNDIQGSLEFPSQSRAEQHLQDQKLSKFVPPVGKLHVVGTKELSVE